MKLFSTPAYKTIYVLAFTILKYTVALVSKLLNTYLFNVVRIPHS